MSNSILMLNITFPQV